MLYQHLLIKDLPYYAATSTVSYFPPHVHHEIEIAFCVEGSFNVVVNGQSHLVPKDHFIFIEKMASHEYLPGDATRLMLEISPVLLREYYKQFSEISPDNPVICLDDSIQSLSPNLLQLRAIFLEIAQEYTQTSNMCSLSIQGNLYKACDIMLREFSNSASGVRHATDDIFMALDLVYAHYNEPITVDMAAQVTGYGKSNFCNIFKKVTGQTFHTYLNHFRIKKSIYLLNETSAGIESIGYMVGFNEPKTFSRVFRSVTGVSPKEYRSRGASASN